jgi:molecular chaperone DnaK
VLVGKGPNGIAVSPDDETVYVVNYQSGTESILDRATTRVTDTIQVEALPTRVSFAPDGKEAYVTNSLAQTISVIDTQELKVVTTLQGASGNPTDKPDGLVVATGGARLYVALFGDGFGRDVLVVSTQSNTRRALKTIRVGEGPFALALAPSLGSSQ